MTMPNFLVIGAPKAGTTTLYQYLNQHPQVYMSPIKEPRFFCNDIKSIDLNNYSALFKGVTSEIAIGEASPQYLFNPIAPEQIHHYLPNAKLIAILRDPAERAYSDYIMRHYLMRRRTKVPGSNEQEIVAEVAKITQDGWIVNTGYYSTLLQRYFDLFEREKIRVYLFEDLKSNPDALMADIFQFIGVNKNHTIDYSVSVYNKSGIPKNEAFYNLINNFRILSNKKLLPLLPVILYNNFYKIYVNLRNRNLAKAPKLPIEIRQQLIEVYREEILQLQDLLKRDLSEWLK